MLTVIGRTYERLGLIDKALPLLEQALEIGRRAFAAARSASGADAERSRRAAAAARQPCRGGAAADRKPVDAAAAGRMAAQGCRRDAQRTGARAARSRAARRIRGADADALAIRLKVFGDEHRETATNKNDLGLLLMERGEIAEAERMFRENIATSERLLGADHPNVGVVEGQPRQPAERQG